jgi:hypothetical protein
MVLFAGITAGLTGCSTPGGVLGNEVNSSPGFIGLTDFASFRKSKEGEPVRVVWTSPEIRTGIDWDELVVSWNAVTPRGCGLRFEARVIYPDRASRFYTLGFWASHTAAQRRESLPRQKDEEGEVKTDTLVLKRPANRLQLRISLLGTNAHKLAKLKFLGLSFLNTKTPVISRPPDESAWGRILPLPERSQLAYPGGADWCSPTSVSMVLAYWARALNRTELDIDVPEVAAGVYDKNWPGTGNWPFNTAFAGSHDGIRACVTCLADVTDLEARVAEGIPPIVSVSFDLLHGQERDEGNGHLVVCVGFTDRGDVVVNDPWARLEAGERVRQIIPRETFKRAWMRSRQTVYLIYPESWGKAWRVGQPR